MKKIYWTRQQKVKNYHGKVRKDLKKLHNTCRGLYETREGLMDDLCTKIGERNADSFDDGTMWYEVPIKVKVEIIK